MGVSSNSEKTCRVCAIDVKRRVNVRTSVLRGYVQYTWTDLVDGLAERVLDHALHVSELLRGNVVLRLLAIMCEYTCV